MLNDMLLEILKNYFKSHINKPSIDFKWMDEDNEKLFSYLSESVSDLNISDSNNLLTIEQALKEHFESVGSILFKLSKDNQIHLKIVPYKTEPKDSVNIDAIIDIIDANEHLVQENYNSKKDLICIKKDLALQIIHFVASVNDEEINKKELLKFAVREAFELNRSDIIVIKNNQIFIKLFDEKEVRKISEDEKETIANRYNGIDENNLKSFYNDIFLKEDNKNFFYFVAGQFVDTYFLEKQINNITYEKYVFSLVQAIVREHLLKSFDNSEEFFKGFSGYLFRIHFKEVFGHIASLVLSEISTGEKYLIEFLKYYSLNIVVQDGQKYKVPEIEAKNGLKWNVASMISIVKIYIKTEAILKTLKKKIAELEEKISDYFIGGRSPVEYNNNLNHEVVKITQVIHHDMKRLNVYLETIDSLKDTKKHEKDGLRKDVIEMKQEIQNLQKTKEDMTAKMIKSERIKKYTELKKELDSISRQQKRDEKILAINRDGYMSIKNSLVKALTSKKIPLEEYEPK